LVGCAAISFGASCGTYGGHCVGCWSRRPSCGPVAASRGHGGDGRSGKWRRTDTNAAWVDQHELEALPEANEARDETSKANIRLGDAPTESIDETEAAEPLKIEDAAEKAKVTKRTVQDAVHVADKGSPELKDAVRRGDVGVNTAAKVADLPPEKQREVVAGGATEISRAARKAKSAKPAKPSQEILPGVALKLGSIEALTANWEAATKKRRSTVPGRFHDSRGARSRVWTGCARDTRPNAELQATAPRPLKSKIENKAVITEVRGASAGAARVAAFPESSLRLDISCNSGSKDSSPPSRDISAKCCIWRMSLGRKPFFRRILIASSLVKHLPRPPGTSSPFRMRATRSFAIAALAAEPALFESFVTHCVTQTRYSSS
jgi:hypothetical protein